MAAVLITRILHSVFITFDFYFTYNNIYNKGGTEKIFFSLQQNSVIAYHFLITALYSLCYTIFIRETQSRAHTDKHTVKPVYNEQVAAAKSVH